MNEQHNPKADKAKHDAALTEAEFLAKQQAQATAAISATFAALKDDLAKGLDPHAWASRHPWVAIGTAAVGGFAAASALVPSKDEQALKKLERIERALRPHEPDFSHPASSSHAAPSQQDQSMGGKLMSHLFSMLKPALSSALAAYAAQPDQNPQSPNGNGHHPSAASGAAAGTTAYYQDENEDQANPT